MPEQLAPSGRTSEAGNEIGEPRLVFPNRTKCDSCGAGPGFFSTGLCSRVECPYTVLRRPADPINSQFPLTNAGGESEALPAGELEGEPASPDLTDGQVVVMIAGATELPVADVQRVIDQLGTWEELGRFARVN